LVAAPRGRFYRARFTIANGKITEVEVVVNPERLRQLHLAVLDDSLH
jgi:RNA polymerase sigma-70 factor (ECF subfamily)